MDGSDWSGGFHFSSLGFIPARLGSPDISTNNLSHDSSDYPYKPSVSFSISRNTLSTEKYLKHFLQSNTASFGSVSGTIGRKEKA